MKEDIHNYDKFSLEDLEKILDDIIKSKKDYNKNREFIFWSIDPKALEKLDKAIKEYINNEYK